jgi:phosphate transport system protein
MTVLLQGAVNELKKRMLTLSARVEQSLAEAVTALRERDADLANQVVRGDSKVDFLEVQLEEECLKLLALHQPVAVDLRFVVAVIKLTNDLERIGDLAADLAERAAALAWQPPIAMPPALAEMPDAVMKLLRQCLDAVVNTDADQARAVCRGDDTVDELHSQNYADVTKRLIEQPDQAERLIQYLSVSRYLERIADHCTNIAEDVIYLVEGQIVRHDAERRQLRAERSEGATEDA